MTKSDNNSSPSKRNIAFNICYKIVATLFLFFKSIIRMAKVSIEFIRNENHLKSAMSKSAKKFFIPYGEEYKPRSWNWWRSSDEKSEIQQFFHSLKKAHSHPKKKLSWRKILNLDVNV